LAAKVITVSCDNFKLLKQHNGLTINARICVGLYRFADGMGKSISDRSENVCKE